jgi:hypothetical protein
MSSARGSGHGAKRKRAPTPPPPKRGKPDAEDENVRDAFAEFVESYYRGERAAHRELTFKLAALEARALWSLQHPKK